jgi:uncharacterized membrane protein YbaN (DUF454 family)
MARVVYQSLGLMLVVVGTIGVFVPLLPTTPFLLLATACFARSSPDWNKRLSRFPLVGQALRDWQTWRGVRTATKAKAIGLMATFAIASLYTMRLPIAVTTAVVLIMAVAAAVVLRLPSRQRAGWEH